jgi:Pectate lyase superfamily protein
MKNLLIISFAALLPAASLSAPAQTVGTIGASTSEALTNKNVNCATNTLVGLQSACTSIDVMNPAYAGGAKCDGTTDDTAAIQAAISSASTGNVTVQFPAGKTCKITGTITVSQQDVAFVGGGVGSTRIDFEPTANGSAFKFSAGATVLYYGSVKGLSICSADTTYTKTGIELADTSGVVIQDVIIGCGGGHQWAGGSAVAPDTQNGSIGVRYRGREITNTSRVTIVADRPIVISKNPNVANGLEAADHDHFWDVYLNNIYAGANVGPLIWVDDGVALTNTTFDGYEAWVGGTYGFYWVTTANAVASYALSIKNARWEQISGTSGYQIYINPNYGLYQLTLENFYGDVTANGYYLRNVTDFTLINLLYLGSATGLNIDSSNTKGFLADVHLNNTSATATVASTSTTGTYFSGSIPATLSLPGIGNPYFPFTVSQSGIPVGMPPSGYLDATGNLIIGQNPPVGATMYLSSSTAGSGITITFNAATLTGTAAGDTNRWVVIQDGAGVYRTFKITGNSGSSTTIAQGTLNTTLTTACTSGSPCAVANIWLSGTAAATNTAGAGGVTYSAPLSRAYANAYMWFPASSPIGVANSNTAGVFYCTMSYTVLGTCYNNPINGAPAIPVSPTAWSLSAGTYTQTTGAYENVLPAVVVPGNSMGASGALDIDVIEANNINAGIKYIQGIFSGAVIGSVFSYTTSQYNRQLLKVWNTGVTGTQIAETSPGAAGGLGSMYSNSFGVGTTSNQNFGIQIQLGTSQFDNAFVEFYSVKAIPSN